MTNASSQRIRFVWLFPLVALAAGYVAGRHHAPAAAEASVAVAPTPQPPRIIESPEPMRARAAARAATAAMPPVPASDAPLSQSFDALAERARAGDTGAAMRLLRDVRRCHERPFLEYGATFIEVLSETDGTSPDNVRAGLAEGMRARDEARRKFDASEALCAGVTAAEIATLGEWLERAADSGDPAAAFCYVMVATSDGYAPADRYSDAWVEWMERYRARALAYAERAFDAGYARASIYLWDVAAGSYIEPAFPLDRDVPPDPARAYGFALLNLALLSNGANAPDAREEWGWRESAQSLRETLDASAIASAESWAAREADRLKASSPPVPPCMDDEE